MTKTKLPKVSALRNIEYYDFQEVLDRLYADSESSKKFKNLMGLITSPQNILLAYLMRHPADGSIEYNDNRLSLYCAQQGKCAVLNMPMEASRIHCHHKKPKAQGGSDAYGNLILVDMSVHVLIHATRKETIERYKAILNLSQKQIEKVNKLREAIGLESI